MKKSSRLRSTIIIGIAALLLAACTQGENIASPGASNPGTPPAGGGSGSGGGGSGSATCPTGFATGTSVGGLTVCNLSGTILSNLTLPFVSGVAYQLIDRIDVGVDGGADCSGGTAATLTIEPGVTVFGASGSDYVVVNRCSQIVAGGSQSAPIVFTSENDIARRAADPTDTGGSAISEWGGLVILGRAPINRCVVGNPGDPGCNNIIEGVTNPEAVYGGAIDNDNSGTLRYVQVRFAGFAINQSGNELNGISFGGVGSGTTVEYVQVHNNSDDGVEFFGGSVNVKYLVLTGNDDDSMDTDNGWDGNVQFVVIKQRTDGGDNGMEMSSAGNAIAPPTNPTIANFSIVGDRSNAFRINSGHVGRFLNGVVMYGQECFRWQDTAGDGDNTSYSGFTDPTFNSVLFDCGSGLTNDAPDTPAAVASVAADANNVIGLSSLTSMLFPGPNENAVTAFDLSTLGGAFFDNVNYIGAFGPNESETNNWATGWTFALFPDPACPTGTSQTGTLNGLNICSIAGVQTTDVTLTRGNYYELEGRVDVGVDIGGDGLAVGGVAADFTIEPGTVVFGNGGSDYLVVNRGSRIFSNGSMQNPVVFTSQADLEDTQAVPAEAIGEWGGLVILGRAPINRCVVGSPGDSGCNNIIEGVTNPEAVYGGALAGDSSGALMYTQVKFAGFAINQSGNELNGISFGGVGNGTTVEYVQVHNNSDDGMEFFGGTVDAKHIVLTGNDDDSMDTDNGWSGNVQFLIIVQRALGGDNGMEMSSAGNSIVPPTNPTIANFTIVGDRSNAFRINSGHVGRFLNGVVSYGQECFRWQDTAGDGDNTSYSGPTDPTYNSVLFDCAVALTNEMPDTPAAVASVAADANNTTGVADSLINIFINGTAEASATAFPNLQTLPAGTFFDNVNYIGAVEDANDRWWAGWSCGLEASAPC